MIMSKKVLLVATVQSHICQFHRPLAALLHENGYEVHVAARDNLAEKNGLKLDFAEKIFNVPFSRSPKSIDNINAYKQLKKIIDTGNYEVVHCNTPMGGIVTRLAARQARKRGTKVYYTAHGFHFYKGAPKKNWLVFYPIEKLFSRFTDKLITITKEDYILAKKEFHCDVFRIHGVGVDDKRYYPVNESEKLMIRQNLGFEDNQKIILCVGELLPNKNQVMAIDMMKKIVEAYPDALLLIAGNGPEEQNLKEHIKEVGLDNNVRMIGYVTNLQDYQHVCDVLVSCSKREGLPLNIVESMLSGTPVVATYNRGHRELIQDSNTGFLVDVDDSIKMSERVLRLFNDNDLYQNISKKAYNYARNYSFPSVRTELKRLYDL